MGIDPFSLESVAPSEIKLLLVDDLAVRDLKRLTATGHLGFLVGWHKFQNPDDKGKTVRVIEGNKATISDVVLEIVDAGLVVDSIRKLHPPEVAQALETYIGKQEI